MKSKALLPEIESPRPNSGELLELESDNRSIEEILEPIADGIGWIVINFNTLEASITDSIRETLSDSPTMDEHILAIVQNMAYSQKVDVFYRMSAMIAHYSDKEVTDKLMLRLKGLKGHLLESSNRRNRYVHADWMGMSKKRYALVKVKVKESGLYNVYRKFQQSDINRDIKYLHITMKKLELFENAVERVRRKHNDLVDQNSKRIKKELKIMNKERSKILV
jgi:hypothetical protein